MTTDNQKQMTPTNDTKYGPMTAHVRAFIDALSEVSIQDARRMDAAWSATRDAAEGAAEEAAWDAAEEAAWDAAWALMVLDLTRDDAALREACETLLAPAREVPALATIIDAAWETVEGGIK